MKIQLKLYASLGHYMPDQSAGNPPGIMEIHEGTTVGDIIERLGIPNDVVKIIFLNGIHAGSGDRLKGCI